MRVQILAATALVAGCKKPPAIENHYYSLVLEASEDRAPTPPAAGAGRVDVVAVHLPDFLLSRSLVLQVNTNEIRHAKHHHWGEPLDIAVRKVIAWDLAEDLPELTIAPGHGRGADCHLSFEFDRFHATDTARIVVSGRYELVQGDRVERREFDVTQVQRGDGYTSAIRGMRRALSELSDELSPQLAGCRPAPSE